MFKREPPEGCEKIKAFEEMRCAARSLSQSSTPLHVHPRPCAHFVFQLQAVGVGVGVGRPLFLSRQKQGQLHSHRLGVLPRETPAGLPPPHVQSGDRVARGPRRSLDERRRRPRGDRGSADGRFGRGLKPSWSWSLALGLTFVPKDFVPLCQRGASPRLASPRSVPCRSSRSGPKWSGRDRTLMKKRKDDTHVRATCS